MPDGSDIYNAPHVTLYCKNEGYRFSPALPPIGSGGMGIVFLGYRLSDSKKVAIKLLRPEFQSNPTLRQRARLEASIQISHPNLVRMLGYSESNPGSGPLYILSEFVDGVSFKQHIDTQLSGLSVRERAKKIVEEFLPVLDAVSCLHARGIIHRDIKPDNLLFQDGCQVKLMDLGVAKADYFFDAHLKGTIGTQPFCAPEQVVNPQVEASTDFRSDIYSLGVTLSYLIGDSFPPDKNVIPEDLAQIISTATTPLPVDRYQRVEDFGNDLKAWLLSGSGNKPSLPSWVIVLIAAGVLLIVCISYLLSR